MYSIDKKNNLLYLNDRLLAIELNESAILISEAYLGGKSSEEIVAMLANEYDVEKDELRKDVAHFLKEMKAMNIDPSKRVYQVLDEEPFLNLHKKLDLHTPIIHIIQNCNSPCTICDCWQTKNKVYHSAKRLKPLFAMLARKGCAAVMLSGGEPLLHPELNQVIKDAQDCDLKIVLNTNGLLLQRNTELIDLKIDQLVVSMDGIDRDSYKKIRGVDGYEIAWDNMERFKKDSPDTHVGIRTVFSRFNFDKLNHYLKKIELHGVDSIGLSPADISSQSFSRDKMSESRKNNLKLLLLPEPNLINKLLDEFFPGNKYYDLIDNAWKRKKISWAPFTMTQCLLFYQSIWSGTLNIFSNNPCNFPKTSLVLDYDGSLKNCFYSSSFGHIDELEKCDWTFKETMKKLEISEKCRSCRGKVFADSSCIS